MTRIITGLTVMTLPQGTRLGFTYSEIDEEGTIVSDNNKGSIIVLDKDILEHIDALKEYVDNWLSKKD